jgi:lytic murein transglycosylase
MKYGKRFVDGLGDRINDQSPAIAPTTGCLDHAPITQETSFAPPVSLAIAGVAAPISCKGRCRLPAMGRGLLQHCRQVRHYAQPTAAFRGVTAPDPVVLEKARFQPEFTTKVWDYLDSRVNPYTIAKGREMQARHARTLSAIERKFGVDASVLLAIWSMESNFGEILTKTDRLHYVPQALATLAYADSRRANLPASNSLQPSKFCSPATSQPGEMTGSWAGAMGHTQFIPTSYLAFAVDADGNGHRDIWNSIPDALATAANLLKKNGWRTGQTWGYEAIAPRGGAKYDGQTKTLSQWAALGFTRPGGKGFPVGRSTCRTQDAWRRKWPGLPDDQELFCHQALQQL